MLDSDTIATLFSYEAIGAWKYATAWFLGICALAMAFLCFIMKAEKKLRMGEND